MSGQYDVCNIFHSECPKILFQNNEIGKFHFIEIIGMKKCDCICHISWQMDAGRNTNDRNRILSLENQSENQNKKQQQQQHQWTNFTTIPFHGNH